MFDRFTDRARKVLGLAREVAVHLGDQYIGSDHLLHAMVEEKTGAAATALSHFDVNLVKVRHAMETIRERSPKMRYEVSQGQLPFTAGTKRLLELASEAADRLHHNYIGTEHLLLGACRHKDSGAEYILRIMKLDPSAIESELLERLGVPRKQPAGDTVGTPADPDYEEMVFQEAESFFDRYQEFTGSVAVYPGAATGNFDALTYVALKLNGESGEFAEKLGKQMRKAGAISAIARENMTEEFKLELIKELGDVLWYVSQAASELGFKLSDVARINRDKLSSRKDRGVLVGEGDNR